MTPLLTFIGYHNSGKTTLVRNLAGYLRRKGYMIAVIKSTKHRDCAAHRPGSDTALYRQDGIEAVALAGPDEVDLFQDRARESLHHLAFRLFPDADLIIGEGFKHEPDIPKIEVARDDLARNLLRDKIANVSAVVGDLDVPGVKIFKPGEIKELAEFIEQHYLRPHQDEDDVSLFVNRKKIPLNFFVRNALKGMIQGFVHALKFTKGATEIDIRIKFRPPF